MTDLETAAANGFEGAEVEELRGYCNRVGLEFHPNMNADTLRKKLTVALGEYREIHGDEEPVNLSVSSKRGKIQKLVSLNLRPTGRWEGKRRIIRLDQSMSHNNTTRPQFFAWGRLHVYVPFGVECSIPYPIYNILKDTSGRKPVRRRQQDDEGRVFYQEQWVASQRFMYSDLGDDPATEHLPDSELDRITMLHGLTDGFEGYGERQFRAMCEALRIPPEDSWVAADFEGAVLSRIGVSGARVDLSVPELEGAVA